MRPPDIQQYEDTCMLLLLEEEEEEELRTHTHTPRCMRLPDIQQYEDTYIVFYSTMRRRIYRTAYSSTRTHI